MKLLDRYGREVETGTRVVIFQPEIVCGSPWTVELVEEHLIAGAAKRGMKAKFTTTIHMVTPGDQNHPGIVRCATPDEIEMLHAEGSKRILSPQ